MMGSVNFSRSLFLSPLGRKRFFHSVQFAQRLLEESVALDCSFYHMRCDHPYPRLFSVKSVRAACL
jgi:hypothetical protein